MYESQTNSKQYRFLDKVYGNEFKVDNIYEEIYSKNFKKTYNGKPTKRYLKLIKKLKKLENSQVWGWRC